MFGCPDWNLSTEFFVERLKAHVRNIPTKISGLQRGTAEQLFYSLLLDHQRPILQINWFKKKWQRKVLERKSRHSLEIPLLKFMDYKEVLQNSDSSQFVIRPSNAHFTGKLF